MFISANRALWHPQMPCNLYAYLVYVHILCIYVMCSGMCVYIYMYSVYIYTYIYTHTCLST